MKYSKKADMYVYPIILIISIVVIIIGIIAMYNQINNDDLTKNNLTDYIETPDFDPEITENEFYKYEAAKGYLFNPLKTNVSEDFVDNYYPKTFNSNSRIINEIISIGDYFPIILNDDLYFIQNYLGQKKIYNKKFEIVTKINKVTSEDYIKSLDKQLILKYGNKDFQNLKELLTKNMFDLDFNEELVSSKFYKDFGYLSFLINSKNGQENIQKYYVYIYDNKKDEVGFYPEENKIVFYNFNKIDDEYFLTKSYYTKDSFYQYIIIYEKDIYDLYLKLIEKEIKPDKILFDNGLFYKDLKDSYRDSINFKTKLSDKYDLNVFDYLDSYFENKYFEEIKEELTIRVIKDYKSSEIIYSQIYFEEIFDSINFLNLKKYSYNSNNNEIEYDDKIDNLNDFFMFQLTNYIFNFDLCDEETLKTEGNQELDEIKEKNCFYIKDNTIYINNEDSRYNLTINQTYNILMNNENVNLLLNLIKKIQS